MTTNRTPIARRLTAMITPVALDAFRRLVALESECVGPPECEPYTSGVPPAMSGGGCNGLSTANSRSSRGSFRLSIRAWPSGSPTLRRLRAGDCSRKPQPAHFLFNDAIASCGPSVRQPSRRPGCGGGG